MKYKFQTFSTLQRHLQRLLANTPILSLTAFYEMELNHKWEGILWKTKFIVKGISGKRIDTQKNK